jgi:hypothetical protein
MDTIKPLDVAISFANEDLGLAIEIRDRIGGTLDVSSTRRSRMR